MLVDFEVSLPGHQIQMLWVGSSSSPRLSHLSPESFIAAGVFTESSLQILHSESLRVFFFPVQVTFAYQRSIWMKWIAATFITRQVVYENYWVGTWVNL